MAIYTIRVTVDEDVEIEADTEYQAIEDALDHVIQLGYLDTEVLEVEGDPTLTCDDCGEEYLEIDVDDHICEGDPDDENEDD